MKSDTDAPPTAATDEPAIPLNPHPIVSAARVSERLADSLVEPALAAGHDPGSNRVQRHDGWTPERIRTFLHALADCGVVEDAARAAGMSRQSAYNLRNRANGGPFDLAWNAAERLARRRLSADVLSRAIHGCVEVIVRDGEVWGERHRFDNRHSMAVLARLDQQAQAGGDENRAARIVAQEFDQFLEIVCAGGEGAAEFLSERAEADYSLGNRTAEILERLDHYRRYGVGLPEEIGASGLARKDRTSRIPERDEPEPSNAPPPGWVAEG